MHLALRPEEKFGFRLVKILTTVSKISLIAALSKSLGASFFGEIRVLIGRHEPCLGEPPMDWRTA